MANLWTADASGLTSAAGPVNADDGNWTADGFVASGSGAYISQGAQFDTRMAGFALYIASALAAGGGIVAPYKSNANVPQFPDQTQAIYSQPVVRAFATLGTYQYGTPQFVDLTQQPLFRQPLSAQGPVPGYISARQEDPTSVNLSFIWTPSIFTPAVVPPVPPSTAAGGLLPGRPPAPPEELGRGMGPYKRPGQVFGEPDPISPRLSSRAPDVSRAALPSVLTQPLLFVEQGFHVEQVDEDTAVFALVALDELCGSDPLRGPIHLRIIRRKI